MTGLNFFTMKDKKNDLPSMPFYFGDWRKAPEIRALDLDVRMIWFEMLGFMWESSERGFLTINGKPVSNSVITRVIGCDIIVLERALQQLEEFNVFSHREDGAIYCRKMVRDEEIRQAKARAGKAGMKKRYSISVNDSVITKPITNTENEIEKNNRLEKDKKSAEKKGKGKEIFELDTSDPMTPVFIQWLDYKKERKEAYKSERGIKAALEELRNLSGNDPDKAQLIIKQSFARNWAGMFELKNYGNSRPTPVQQPKTLEDYAKQDYAGRF